MWSSPRITCVIAHQRIVDHDREVVGGRAVGADDDRIADDVGVKPHVAAHGVVEDDFAIVGHPEPDRRPLAGGDARLRLLVATAGRHGPSTRRAPAASAAWRSASSCAGVQKQW